MSTSSTGDGVAIVLAGAVAQGAFGVGAVSYLAEAEKECPIRRVAATSSGALTATLVAAGVATGDLRFAADVAKGLWLDKGAWNSIAPPSICEWFHLRGLSDTSRLVSIVVEGLRRVVEHAPANLVPHPVKLTLVTTSLNARRYAAGPLPTYEKAISFETKDILQRANWPHIARAAAASATFPVVFAPTLLDAGPCVDGGVVNNAPISYVIDDASVRRVIVITSEAPVLARATQLGGLNLIGRVVDIAINERVAHDMSVAKKTNDRLRAVRAALGSTGASPATTQAVVDALGWRELDLVLVHPDPALRGTSFSGFFCRKLRQQYIDAGARAAKRAL
jgi:predicted acylesterase/phospholipase RssA